MEEPSTSERRQIEIELLQAMYPDQTQHDPRSDEFKYTSFSSFSSSSSSTTASTNTSSSNSGGRSTITLRLPDTYPERALPLLVSATDPHKNDIRRRFQHVLDDMRLLEGEEVLDAIVQGFEGCLETVGDDSQDGVSCGNISTTTAGGGAASNSKSSNAITTKTVVIWLHHLLNTNKRKLALNPSLVVSNGGAGEVLSQGSVNASRMESGKEEKKKRRISRVSGITKPGYPGILVYSGPSDLVDSHVVELRQQKWQAFQVRFDDEFNEYHEGGGDGESGKEARDGRYAWRFEHGESIKEVESMAEVVQGITDLVDRETFLKATGVK